MITVFNRKEVLMGLNQDAFQEARIKLELAHIPYKYKILFPPSGMPFIRLRNTSLYYLYVRRGDEEAARRLLR